MTTKEKAFKSSYVGEIPLLDHSNYHAWKTAMIDHLEASGNYRIVAGAEINSLIYQFKCD